MSFVSPSFSHAFLNRRSICSAVSLPRDFTLIIRSVLSETYALFVIHPGCCEATDSAIDAPAPILRIRPLYPAPVNPVVYSEAAIVQGGHLAQGNTIPDHRLSL